MVNVSSVRVGVELQVSISRQVCQLTRQSLQQWRPSVCRLLSWFC